MGSETREIVMAFSREFGETESPPRWDMKMERCLGRWLKGPLFLFELQSEVVMRNRLVLLAALMWCLSGVAAAAPAMDIVLYPSSAQVQVDDTLPVKNGAVAFVVPAGTDLESLVISLDKGEVISRRAIPVLVADSETVAALRQDLAEARAHAAGLEGEAAAVAARISLWSKGALAQEISLAEMEKLDAAMPERLKALYVQAAALEPQVKEAREGVARLEQALSEYGDAATGTQVEAQVGDLSGNVRVRYSYMLSLNDLLNNAERVGDHCSNIAVSVIEEQEKQTASHAYLHSLKKNDEFSFQLQQNLSRYVLPAETAEDQPAE